MVLHFGDHCRPSAGIKKYVEAKIVGAWWWRYLTPVALTISSDCKVKFEFFCEIIGGQYQFVEYHNSIMRSFIICDRIIILEPNHDSLLAYLQSTWIHSRYHSIIKVDANKKSVQFFDKHNVFCFSSSKTFYVVYYWNKKNQKVSPTGIEPMTDG